MNFRYCLSPYCFSYEIVRRCMGLLLKSPWFTFAHTEIGGGASFALLNKGRKNSRVSTSSTGTRLFERCCQSLEVFIELIQRGPREREARYLRFTIQRLGNLVYIPDLLAHAVLESGHGFTNDFIRIVGRYYIKSTKYFSKAGWVYFWCASW